MPPDGWRCRVLPRRAGSRVGRAPNGRSNQGTTLPPAHSGSSPGIRSPGVWPEASPSHETPPASQSRMPRRHLSVVHLPCTPALCAGVVQQPFRGRGVKADLVSTLHEGLPLPESRYRTKYNIVVAASARMPMSRSSHPAVHHEAPKVLRVMISTYKRQRFQRTKRVTVDLELQDGRLQARILTCKIPRPLSCLPAERGGIEADAEVAPRCATCNADPMLKDLIRRRLHRPMVNHQPLIRPCGGRI